MFKVIRDGGIRYKAASYLKNIRYQNRALATNQEVVSSADVVIIGKYRKYIFFV